jgi:hypothetical protein
MHGVAGKEVAVGVWHPANVMARPMVNNVAGKGRCMALMVWGKLGCTDLFGF